MDKYQEMDPVALLEEVRKLDARINSLPQSHFNAASERKTNAGVCHVLRDDQL